jgi:cell division transport system permease protein
MRLVGATDRFIQAPMISKASYQGFYSSIIAIFMLIGAIQFTQSNSPNSLNIQDLKTIGIIFLIIFIFGILLSVLSTYFAVKKYIKLNENELYN